MTGFYLLCAHLVGDYLFQNDWQAKWKAADGTTTEDEERALLSLHGDLRLHESLRLNAWAAYRPWVACGLHCLLYTLAIALFTFWWMPLWGYVACYAIHFVIDRFKLARLWMIHVSGQEYFATGPLAPWSIIVVDNTFHLLTLAAIAALAGVS